MSEFVSMVAPENLPALPGEAPSFTTRAPPPVNGIPLFEVVAVKDVTGQFQNVEFVSIITPGDKNAMPRHKVTPTLIEMYRPWYEHWRKGLELAPSGTPLEMWPILTPAQVRELKVLNIFTVEQLKGIPDTALQNLPFGRTLRNQAVAWLDSKKEADLVEVTRAQNETLKQGMLMLEKQMQAMQQQLDAAKALGVTLLPAATVPLGAIETVPGITPTSPVPGVTLAPATRPSARKSENA